MGLGRRAVGVHDAQAWVFNRMAHVYDARPAYPPALIDAIVDVLGASGAGASIADLGAGTGHLALPLAERGFDVTAVEPAIEMLECLRSSAARRGLALTTLHATAEAIPVDDGSFHGAVIADALHFLDAELTGIELARVLVPSGALALVTSELGDTPFMQRLLAVMEEAAPRRPREVMRAVTQTAALAEVTFEHELSFEQHVPVDHDTLERILRSISFIGPAMNPARFAAFRERVRGLSDAPVWSRTFTLRAGHRRG